VSTPSLALVAGIVPRQRKINLSNQIVGNARRRWLTPSPLEVCRILCDFQRVRSSRSSASYCASIHINLTSRCLWLSTSIEDPEVRRVLKKVQLCTCTFLSLKYPYPTSKITYDYRQSGSRSPRFDIPALPPSTHRPNRYGRTPNR
jgi:hypothetical protein